MTISVQCNLFNAQSNVIIKNYQRPQFGLKKHLTRWAIYKDIGFSPERTSLIWFNTKSLIFNRMETHFNCRRSEWRSMAPFSPYKVKQIFTIKVAIRIRFDWKARMLYRIESKINQMYQLGLKKHRK